MKGRIENLRELGFMIDGIVELIVTTSGINGPNAAPMGASLDKSGVIILRPFTRTRTYKNLIETRCAVLNITNDPYLFYLTTFKDRLGFPKELFESAEVVNSVRIKGCNAYVEVTVSKIAKEGERAIVKCDVKHVTFSPTIPQAYCRAKFAVIESLIHATRLIEFKKLGKDTSELIRLMKHYQSLVSRVAPGSIYEEIMKSLLKVEDESRR